MSAFRYDVFVSYRRVEPDATWVRTVLVPRLQSAGVSLCVDELSFVPGRLLLREMERAVETSRFTAAVMSPVYLEGAFADLEAVMAQHLSLEERTERFVVLMRAATPKAPIGVRARLWLDMTDDATFETEVGRLVHLVLPDEHEADAG